MIAFADKLPIDEVLPRVTAALAQGRNLVVVAPPGAGKTTRIPLALLDADWAMGGKIILLEPRRLAARAAAARMAASLRESVGETIGLRMRLESKISAKTRVEVVTEGVFARMILDDPMLEGVVAVLFDEFHERSLDADVGLALALDAQAGLRDDLRIVAMSATLDGARVAGLMGGAEIVESEGRAFPVETRYLGRDSNERLEEAVIRAVTRALAEERGSILVFLPGQGEIQRVANFLGERRLPADVDIAPLFGAMDRKEQDLAVAPAAPGRRKVTLATSIAETSLTIEGVRVVIDSGLSRVAVFEPDLGLTRLETVRAARASVDQRRGRAGRGARRRASAIACGTRPRPFRCPLSPRRKSSPPISPASRSICAPGASTIRASSPGSIRRRRRPGRRRSLCCARSALWTRRARLPRRGARSARCRWRRASRA